MIRLDNYLTENSLTDSRNIAKELILNDKVMVDNKIINKPAFKVDDNSKIEILTENIYVSRAAYKLKGFLDYLDLDIKKLNALDIGSSRGGFTEILLEYGANKITCVDVGDNQLHQKLRDNNKVHLFENMDIRNFNKNEEKNKDKRFDLITCDISFISVLNIVDDIDRLASNYIILLFKPQFEVGKDAKRDKKGVVTDKKVIQRTRDIFLERIMQKWKYINSKVSEIKGKEGNIEELFLFKKI